MPLSQVIVTGNLPKGCATQLTGNHLSVFPHGTTLSPFRKIGAFEESA
jgi:hypothetical protein